MILLLFDFPAERLVDTVQGICAVNVFVKHNIYSKWIFVSFPKYYIVPEFVTFYSHSNE